MHVWGSLTSCPLLARVIVNIEFDIMLKGVGNYLEGA
jgi:hypothetical protein